MLKVGASRARLSVYDTLHLPLALFFKETGIAQTFAQKRLLCPFAGIYHLRKFRRAQAILKKMIINRSATFFIVAAGHKHTLQNGILIYIGVGV